MLIVVRHGRTPANAAGQLLGRRDPELDELGRAQAAAVGAAVPDGARVISSPLMRCRQTASAIAAEVEIDERLIEVDYGAFEGLAMGEVPAETWAEWRADTAWSPPGGESHDDLAARVWPLLDELRADAAERDVVLVSHVSPIKACLAWGLGVPIDVAWRAFVGQASVLRISTNGPSPSLRSFNETHHLDDLA
ncbi:MAG: histidine phosphatase family protein [Actinomycetota bacterium]